MQPLQTLGLWGYATIHAGDKEGREARGAGYVATTGSVRSPTVSQMWARMGRLAGHLEYTRRLRVGQARRRA